jgi:cytochrome P450
MALSLVTIIALSTGLFLLYRLSRIGSRPKNYPPGPPTVPVVGNIHLMPEADIHGQLKRWAEEYGPIYSLMLGTSTTVVLSGYQTVKDLLDKRSAFYSSRPEMFIVRLLSADSRMVLMVGISHFIGSHLLSMHARMLFTHS